MKDYQTQLEGLLERLGWSKAYFANIVNADTRSLQRWCKLGRGTGYNPCVAYLELVCRILGK